MPEASQGFPAGSGQSSGKNLKITFVGDRALLKQQRQGPKVTGSQAVIEAVSNLPDQRIHFHQTKKGAAETNLNSYSNTGA